MTALGLDIGSSWTKAVLLEGKEVLALKAIPTAGDFKGAGLRAAKALLKRRGLDLKGVEVVVTGYGREAFPWGRKVTELSCQAMGVWRLRPSVGTIIDVGGQDTKVIRVGEGGRLLSFAMNDRCAAGTGRFLEAMARVLRMGVARVGLLAKEAKGASPINSTCAVFAETEVIGLLASGRPKEEVCLGILRSVSRRIGSLVRGFGLEGEVALVGGAAKIPFFRETLEEELGVRFPELSFDPQFTGALGAALLVEKGSKEGEEDA